MAGQDWPITIIPSSSGGAAQYQPDVPGAKPGDPLRAENADLVHWNNRTPQPHQPWAIDPSTGQPFPTAEAAKAKNLYLSDEIAPWQPSSPAFPTSAPPVGFTTIDYICNLHDGEKGSIIVSAAI
jgi:plastocyanin